MTRKKDHMLTFSWCGRLRSRISNVPMKRQSAIRSRTIWQTLLPPRSSHFKMANFGTSRVHTDYWMDSKELSMLTHENLASHSNLLFSSIGKRSSSQSSLTAQTTQCQPKRCRYQSTQICLSSVLHKTFLNSCFRMVLGLIFSIFWTKSGNTVKNQHWTWPLWVLTRLRDISHWLKILKSWSNW